MYVAFVNTNQVPQITCNLIHVPALNPKSSSEGFEGSWPTSGVNSLDLIGGPAWSASTQPVESSDSIGVPLTLDQAGHLESVSTEQYLIHS